MKAVAVVLSVLLLLSGVHVRMWLAGYPAAVPMPALALAAELAVCAALGRLIWRNFRAHPCPYWRSE